MTSPAPAPRPAYDELGSPETMRSDALRAGVRLQRAAARAARPAPGLGVADQPRETRKREITVSEAAQRLAGSLGLHLD